MLDVSLLVSNAPWRVPLLFSRALTFSPHPTPSPLRQVAMYQCQPCSMQRTWLSQASQTSSSRHLIFMLLMRLVVTNSSTFCVLTAALGHYSNVPIQIKWMQRLLWQLLATEHLASNNSILGPSGTFLYTCIRDTKPSSHYNLGTSRGTKTILAFVDEETKIQIREHHAENK